MFTVLVGEFRKGLSGSLFVQKYGGTSLETPEKISAVSERIALSYHLGNHLIIVVSAMGHTTDALIDLAYQVSSSPPEREMDMLLTVGERISMSLLTMALAKRKVPAISLTGSQSGIITDTSHRCARILKILGDRVRIALLNRQVVIIAGFQGVSETKEITTLGRGGSDTSAVALAAVFQADSCDIFTDVDGIYSADPRFVPRAKRFKRLSYDVMVEMANRGASVLHPRSVELAKQFKVPLRVCHSIQKQSKIQRKKGGTVILTDEKHFFKKETAMEEFRVIAVTADRDKMCIQLQLTRFSSLSTVWSRTIEGHLAVIAPVFSNKEVRFFSDREAKQQWKKILDLLVFEGFVKKYEIDLNTVPLSIVGNRFAQDGAALHKMISALLSKGIEVTLGSASSLAITVGVSLDRVDESILLLHNTFCLTEV